MPRQVYKEKSEFLWTGLTSNKLKNSKNLFNCAFNYSTYLFDESSPPTYVQLTAFVNSFLRVDDNKFLSLLLARLLLPAALRHQFPFRSSWSQKPAHHIAEPQQQCWICMIKRCKLEKRYILCSRFNRDSMAGEILFHEFRAFRLFDRIAKCHCWRAICENSSIHEKHFTAPIFVKSRQNNGFIK